MPIGAINGPASVRVADGIMTAALLPLCYYAMAAIVARRFAARHIDVRSDAPAPPFSILKPVRGLDSDAYERYATFCVQNYPEYEVLFGVAENDDPAVPVIRQIIENLPTRRIRLITPIPEAGPNAKVSILCRLAREARHDLLVVADADVAAPSSLLRSIADRFTDPHVGIVTCLYRGDPAGHGVAPALEALGISTEFIPGVLVAERLEGLRFALGATMAARRACVDQLGGFEALLDYCADDFELGCRVARLGYEVRLANAVVTTVCADEGVRRLFRHQLRWAVTQRQSRPWGWTARTFVTQGLPWSIAAALVSPSYIAAAAYFAGYAVLRFAAAWTIGANVLDDPTVRRRWWLLPAYDAFSCVVSMAALVTNRIEWRGRRFTLTRGRLVPLASARRRSRIEERNAAVPR
jgi:ceramide glucosyltransferase